MKYESELINEILEKRGHELPSLHYQSECVKTWINETKGAYPKLCDYQSEWLNYINENPLGEIVLNGSSDVIYESEYGVFYVQANTLVKLSDYSTAIISDKGRVLKDHEYVRNYDSDDFVISGYNDIYNSYPNDNWIYFAKKDITSTSDMKTWLAQNPIKIQYPLTRESINPSNGTPLKPLFTMEMEE